MELCLEEVYVKQKGVINSNQWLMQPFLQMDFDYFMLEVGRYIIPQENGAGREEKFQIDHITVELENRSLLIPNRRLTHELLY